MNIERIVVSKSVTLRVADYESLKLEITLEATSDESDTTNGAIAALVKCIDGHLFAEATKVGYRGIAKFVGSK